MQKTDVPNWDDGMANERDIANILGEKRKMTWDDFNLMLKQERDNGIEHCPQASYIALELLTPQILKLPFKGSRTNSETVHDYLQDAYLLISKKISDFDPEQSSFKTYIMKWMQALARETRSDGVSKYQKEKFGFHVISVDAMASKANLESDSEAVVEFIDESSLTEDILDRKEKERANALLFQTMKNVAEKQESVEKDETYKNLACYRLCMGGIQNMPEGLKDKLEDIIREE